MCNLSSAEDAGRRTQRDMGIAVPGIVGQVEIAPMATTSYSCEDACKGLP